MASKDKTTGMWMAQWYEVDAYGKKKRCKKRGFKTAREAKKYEYEKSLKVEGSMNMLLKDFVDVYFCKIYNKNVGLRQNKNVGKPTFLFCILGHIDTLLLEVFQYENQFTRRVNHHGQFRG